jgi:hypothetical protein
LDKTTNKGIGKTMAQEMQIDIINEEDMEFVKRGRKSNLSELFVQNVQKLIKDNNAIQTKKFLVLKELTIPSELKNEKDIKNYKAKTSAMLRGLGNRLGYKIEIRWHKETIPAIRFSLKK